MTEFHKIRALGYQLLELELAAADVIEVVRQGEGPSVVLILGNGETWECPTLREGLSELLDDLAPREAHALASAQQRLLTEYLLGPGRF